MNNNTPKKVSSSFIRTFLRGEISYGFWGGITTTGGLINTFLVISALTIYQYGVFQLLLSSYALLAVLIGLGGETIRNDLLRLVGEGKESSAKKIFLENTTFRLVIGVMLWAFVFFNADLFSFRFGPEFIFHIKIISFLFLHDALLSSLRLALDARKRFQEIASRASITKFVQFGIMAYFLFFSTLGLKEVLMAFVISYFVALAFLLPPFVRSYLPWRHLSAANESFLYKILSSYGKWEIFRPATAKFGNFIQVWFTKLFIGTEAVAIFSVAQTIVGTIAGSLPVKTLSTLVPLEIVDKERAQKIFSQGLKYLLVLSLLFSIAGALFVPPLINWFFSKYAVSLPYFYFLLITLPISAFSVIASIFLVAFRRQKFLFFQKIAKTLIGIPFYLLLLPPFGLWGLAVHSLILSLILNGIVYWQLHYRTKDIKIDWFALCRFGKDDWEFIKKIWQLSVDLLLKKFWPTRGAQ